MVRAGTLTIESAGEHGQESLDNIPRSDQQQQTINRLIEQDSERRSRQAYGGGPGPGYQARPAQGQAYPSPQGYEQQGPPYPPTQQYPQQ